ncbi:hypothetical protein [Deinococcus arenicola]|uniref:Uncharacterized protein n=1 Tax=Deinococcus arenicola TaxID=2994950 RepID=A0ABU4DP93_9DEIO|nr:hypothetical protein [Deinococcus sp. ZS9-10]MDV6374259.1 hypothetical protein [Deinococcus sp. ZS9-10]
MNLIPALPLARWRALALGFLWAEVVAVFGMVAFILLRGQPGPQDWINAFDALLAGLVLTWWTQVFTRLSTGQAMTPENGTLRALTVTFPWLTSFRAALWGLTLLSLTTGAASKANPVALTALMTVWGMSILASNAVNGSLVRLAPEPADPARRKKLMDWLNLSAALALGMAVFNVVPIVGFSSDVTLAGQLVYGVGGLLDVIATVLALWVLMGLNGKQTRKLVKEGERRGG